MVITVNKHVDLLAPDQTSGNPLWLNQIVAPDGSLRWICWCGITAAMSTAVVLQRANLTIKLTCYLRTTRHVDVNGDEITRNMMDSEGEVMFGLVDRDSKKY